MNVLKKCKSFSKQVIISCGALRFANKFAPLQIAILRYHLVQDDPVFLDGSIDMSIIHSTFVFKEQMEIVAKEFNVVTLNDVLQFLRNEKEIPKKSVAITFDDGYVGNYEVAAPILDHFGIPATFYMAVGSIESTHPLWFIRLRHAIWTSKKTEIIDPANGQKRLKIQTRDDRIAIWRLMCKRCANLFGAAQETVLRDIEQALDVQPFEPKKSFMMNWDMIKKLHHAGHIIGSHTINHLNLAYLKSEETLWELTESKRILEKELCSRVIHFSYPNPTLTPHFTEQTTVAVEETGYETAVISAHGPVSNSHNPLVLNRVSVPVQIEEFLWNLECTLLGRHV